MGGGLYPSSLGSSLERGKRDSAFRSDQGRKSTALPEICSEEADNLFGLIFGRKYADIPPVAPPLG